MTREITPSLVLVVSRPGEGLLHTQLAACVCDNEVFEMQILKQHQSHVQMQCDCMFANRSDLWDGGGGCFCHFLPPLEIFFAGI